MPEDQDVAGTAETNADVVRDEQGRFVPGHSGNPGGRAPGIPSLTATLRRIVNSRYNPNCAEDLRTQGEVLIEAAIDHARAGNASFFQQILDRLEGKVPERLQTSFGPGWEFVFEPPPEPPAAIPAAVPEQGGDA